MKSQSDTAADNAAPPPAQGPDIERLSSTFRRAVWRARAAIFVERLAPKLMPPAAMTGLFLSGSWVQLWQMLPPTGRMFALIGFAAAAVLSPKLVKSGSLRVTRAEALQRLDENTGDPSLPAHTLADRPDPLSTPGSEEMWKIHTQPIWEKWGDKMKAGNPRINMQSRDPHRLRYAVVLCTALTAAYAGGEIGTRLKDVFDFSTPVVPVPPVEAEAYVRAPERINGPEPKLTAATKDHTQGGSRIFAHKNSMMTILVFGDNKVTINGTDITAQKVIPPSSKSNGKPTYRYEVQLTQENTAIMIANGPRWNLSVTPDAVPDVSLDGVTISKDNPNSLDVNYTKKDDHGIEESAVEMKAPGERPVDATPLPSAQLPRVYLP